MEREMSKKFEAGEVAYTFAGQQVEYVAEAGGEYVVRYGWEDPETGDAYYDRVGTEQRLFREPPVAHRSDEIAKLEAREHELRGTIRALEADLRKQTAAAQETLNRWSAYAELEHLDDYLNGRITHFVLAGYSGVSIEEKGAALEQDPDRPWDKKQKLLTLFGDSNGNLKWMLNRWRDGSGHWGEVWPCLSLDEAQTKAQEIINERFDLWRKDPRAGWISYTVQSAIKLGLHVPDDVASALREAKKTSALEKIRKAEAQKAAAEAELAALEVVDDQ
jgi:hypothetical protein